MTEIYTNNVIITKIDDHLNYASSSIIVNGTELIVECYNYETGNWSSKITLTKKLVYLTLLLNNFVMAQSVMLKPKKKKKKNS